MSTLISQNDNILEVSVDGRLDASTSEEFIERIESRLNEDISTITLDCNNLEYISSAGLRALMALCDDLSDKEGKIILENVQDQVKEVLKLTGMIELFEFK